MEFRTRFLIFPFLLLATTLACSLSGIRDRSSGGSNDEEEETLTSATQAYNDNPCYNVLFPLNPNWQWIYQITGAEESTQMGFTVEEVVASQAKVNALNLATGIITETYVECEDGTIQHYPAMTMSMIVGDDLGGAITTEYISGAYAPNEDTFIEANWYLNWDVEFLAEGSLLIKGEEDEIPMVIVLQQSPVHISWQTAGEGSVNFESVTVPAGTYPSALRIMRSLEMDAVLQIDDLVVDGTLMIKTVHWFEPFVGLLKVKVDHASITYMGLTFPIAVEGLVELMEFHQNQ